ncbi:MAG: fumarylacetoacetate hydrolase family protein [Sphingomonadaceae bacterium]
MKLPSAPRMTFAPTTTGEAFPVRRIFCVGRNYAEHAREMGRDPDREPPFFFTKWAETVVPGGTVIAYPQKTGNYHYEGELVVAIGKGGASIAVEDALSHVWGYAAGLDMTRRDLQLEARGQGRPWDTGKNVEQSAPTGLIRPAAEFGQPTGGAITLEVNGVIKQSADLADLIWPVADIISILSDYYHLEPGDLIFTGTPAGVGAVIAGDRIDVKIAGLDTLSVTVSEPAH